MVDFTKLAEDIYEAEQSHHRAIVQKDNPMLSTYCTIPTIVEGLNLDERTRYVFIEKYWENWWYDWAKDRRCFIERFKQITPDIEVLIIERTLREHFDK